MKREVWVECDKQDSGHYVYPGLPHEIKQIYVKQITLHESRWIPVSEKPEREGRYPVVFDSQREFDGSSSYWDGNNWCGPVKLWLEVPPLQVYDGFDKEWDYYQCREPILRDDGIAKKACKWFWNKAKESNGPRP